MGEEGRVLERGDKDIDDNLMELSLLFPLLLLFPFPLFNDHNNSPPDFISTLPNILNFDEGLIFDPDNNSNLNTGARESRIDNSNTFSHLRTSSILLFLDLDLPLITILNTS